MKYFTIICLLITSINLSHAKCDNLKKKKDNKKENETQLEQIEKPVHKCPSFIFVNDNIIVKSCT